MVLYGPVWSLLDPYGTIYIRYDKWYIINDFFCEIGVVMWMLPVAKSLMQSPCYKVSVAKYVLKRVCWKVCVEKLLFRYVCCKVFVAKYEF